MKRQGLVGAALAASLFVAKAASACGGFFCQPEQPVEQAGEQIVFAVDGTTVTTIVQVQYEGPSEAFSWVLPVPSKPSVGVSTDELFTRLRQVTDPAFRLEILEGEDGCRARGCEISDASFAVDASEATDGTDGVDGVDGGVDILDQGAVGPYDYTVIEADTGDLLYTWLDDNGYDQPPEAKAEITHYVNQKFVFVAVKLQKDVGAGSVVPISLPYESSTFACVPLRLTSIAATPDMPVRAWVLAKARAVPVNYFHATVNARALPWMSCARGSATWGCDQAYWDLVSRASDAGEGRTFVTEYARTVDPTGFQLPLFSLNELSTASDAEYFFSLLSVADGGTAPQVLETLSALMPMKPGAPGECANSSQFYGPLFEECRSHHLSPEFVFDSGKAAAAIETALNEPIRAANTLFETHSYITRLYTRISPDEMTLDPLFSFNADLPDVSNVHTLRLTPECAGGSKDAIRYRAEWPTGEVDYTATDRCGEPELPPSFQQPALGDLQILTESGPAEIIRPDAVPSRIAALEGRAPSPGKSTVVQTGTARASGFDTISGTLSLAPAVGGSDIDWSSGGDGNGTGCSLGGSSSPWLPLLLSLLALLGAGTVGRARR